MRVQNRMCLVNFCNIINHSKLSTMKYKHFILVDSVNQLFEQGTAEVDYGCFTLSEASSRKNWRAGVMLKAKWRLLHSHALYVGWDNSEARLSQKCQSEYLHVTFHCDLGFSNPRGCLGREHLEGSIWRAGIPETRTCKFLPDVAMLSW